jgi:cbb3-type cytochrome oxidase maturation protein
LACWGWRPFFWSLHAGQFDDLDGAALRILMDDDGDAPMEERL